MTLREMASLVQGHTTSPKQRQVLPPGPSGSEGQALSPSSGTRVSLSYVSARISSPTMWLVSSKKMFSRGAVRFGSDGRRNSLKLLGGDCSALHKLSPESQASSVGLCFCTSGAGDRSCLGTGTQGQHALCLLIKDR